MGTTRDSSTVKSVFNSLIHELRKKRLQALKEESSDSEIEQNKLNGDQLDGNKFKKMLTDELNNFLKENENRKIIIFLDSIDQLSERDYSLDWMIYDLPKNVKMIYSVLNDYKRIFDSIKMRIENNHLNYPEFEDFKLAVFGFFAALSTLAAESVLGQDFRSRVRDKFSPISVPITVF